MKNSSEKTLFQLVAGGVLGIALGSSLYSANVRWEEEPKVLLADFNGNPCLEASGPNGTCPSGGFNLGTYCYLPGGASCTMSNGLSGACAAGACFGSCPEEGASRCVDDPSNEEWCCFNGEECVDGSRGLCRPVAPPVTTPPQPPVTVVPPPPLVTTPPQPPVTVVPPPDSSTSSSDPCS